MSFGNNWLFFAMNSVFLGKIGFFCQELCIFGKNLLTFGNNWVFFALNWVFL